MVSFSSVSQCVAMYLMVSTMMSGTIAAPASGPKGGSAIEIAAVLAAAAASGLINKLGPEVIKAIKEGDFTKIPQDIWDKLKSMGGSIGDDGRFVVPKENSNQKRYDDLD